ncbi:protein phosphatase 2 (formerly 2A), regulatory subunit B [Trypanosoma cruzi]|nr:protein phosphatase 2 (formerly 2A), regulatory subunit B [Trypanosoma cruzi]
MVSNRSLSAPPGGGSLANDSNHFGYRWGELSVGGFSPSPPPSSPWPNRPQTFSRYESSADWRKSPSYGGNRYGAYFRRNCGGAYGRVSHEFNRGYSSRSASALEEQDLPFPPQGRNGRFNAHRSSSTPVWSQGPSYPTYQTPSPRYNRRRSGSSSSVSNAAKGKAEIPLLLASAFSEKQTTRVLVSLERSSTFSQAGIRLKLLEYLGYWMSDVLTGAAVEKLIMETYREADLKDTHTSIGERKKYSFSEVSNVMNTGKIAGDRHAQEGEKVNGSNRATSHLLSPSSSFSSLSLSSASFHRSESKNTSEGAAVRREQETQGKWERGTGKHFRRDIGTDASSTTSEGRVFSLFRSCGVESMATKQVFLTAEPKILPQQTAVLQTSPLIQATYSHVPRFYFPKGAQKTTEETLVGPMKKKHENPHLRVLEGMVIPTAVHTNSEERAAVMSDDVFKRHEVKKVPIAPLKAVEDKCVHMIIRKEFGRLPVPPKIIHGTRPQSSAAKGFIGLNNGMQTRQGLNYRIQLTQAMKRICTQCFGLPKYFAFLIVRILQANVDFGNSGVVKSGRSSSTMALSSPATGSPSASQTEVMVRQLLGFFETYLRGRCIVRRVFEVLLLSSRVATSGSETSTRIGNDWRLVYDGEKQQQRSYLLPDDFRAYIEVLLEHHPGLLFLKQTPDFQSKYLDTVTHRIFYDLDRFNRGRITYAEMERSSFLDSIRQVDATNDINSVLLYFSYEHFYVLYCRFWELDKDRDMLLSRREFMNYAPEGVMNPIIADRVFTGAGRRKACTQKDRINYEDFVWFCLSEEDKSTPTAIRYWFRILDLDGDGLLSAYELRSFYDEMKKTVTSYAPDGAVPFEDILCQIFDMFGLETSCSLRLEEFLAKPEAAAVTFNMVTNVVRFLQFEQKDPFVTHQNRLEGGLEQSAWDRFARAEYGRLSNAMRKE